jgi:hypothetical protein
MHGDHRRAVWSARGRCRGSAVTLSRAADGALPDGAPPARHRVACASQALQRESTRDAVGLPGALPSWARAFPCIPRHAGAARRFVVGCWMARRFVTTPRWCCRSCSPGMWRAGWRTPANSRVGQQDDGSTGPPGSVRIATPQGQVRQSASCAQQRGRITACETEEAAAVPGCFPRGAGLPGSRSGPRARRYPRGKRSPGHALPFLGVRDQGG